MGIERESKKKNEVAAFLRPVSKVSVKEKIWKNLAVSFHDRGFIERWRTISGATVDCGGLFADWEELQPHRCVNAAATAGAFMNYTSADRARMVSHIIPVSGVSRKRIRYSFWAYRSSVSVRFNLRDVISLCVYKKKEE